MGSRGLRAPARRRGASSRPQVVRTFPVAALAAAGVFVPGAAARDGEVVATLALEAPAAEEFVLHGTLPVARGAVPLDAKDVPLAVLQIDGGDVAPTQVEVVSRYPSDEDGADVVEVIARVRRPLGVPPGKRVSYPVVLQSQPHGTVALHPDVAELFSTDGALELRASDVFGHVYRADLPGLLQDPDRALTVRDGALVRERRVHAPLLPEQPKGGPEGTLPHLMGVHAYVRTLDAEPFFFLDLHVHNGFDGLLQTTSDDDALQEIFFRRFELRLPYGWRVFHAFEHPAIGNSHRTGPWVDHRLLGDQPYDKLYVMPRQSHFVRRLAIAPADAGAKARAALEERHLAFCRPGTDTEGGGKLWSWWNRDTARYFAQRQRLPQLEHVDLQGLREWFESELAYREWQLAEGRAGKYPLYSGRLGWAQPWGVQYGGMTGGDEIFLFDGLQTAAAASRAGYRLAQLTMRAYMDRQPTALYDLHGRPTTVDDVVFDGPGGPYVTATFSLLPKSGDPFGFDDAPTFQTEAVEAADLAPWWRADLAAYSPIDHQHYVRYTRNLKVLTWLGNDSLAKAELEAAAENFHFSFHQYPFDKWGYIEPNGLLWRMKLVEEDPHEGLPIGRGEAWGLDVAAAAYSTAGPEFRARTRPWLELVVRTIENGQSTCTGNLMALHVGKLLDGRFLVRRSNESAFLEHALLGINESVLRGADEERAAAVDQMVVKSVRSGLNPPYWSEEHEAAWMTVAVSPQDHSHPEYCDRVPPSGFDGPMDIEYPWSPIAYAYQLSGDAFFLHRATQLAGGEDVWEALHEDGLKGIEGRAAILALVQTLHETAR